LRVCAPRSTSVILDANRHPQNAHVFDHIPPSEDCRITSFPRIDHLHREATTSTRASSSGACSSKIGSSRIISCAHPCSAQCTSRGECVACWQCKSVSARELSSALFPTISRFPFRAPLSRGCPRLDSLPFAPFASSKSPYAWRPRGSVALGRALGFLRE
jgi:hypothetical protein